MPVKSEDVGAVGLWTNPNPELKRPPGALERADEVVFRRPNMAEPRPGFSKGVAIGALINIAEVLSYDHGLLVVGNVVGVGFPKTYNSGAEVFVEDGTTSPPWDSPDNIRGCEARGNFYLTTSDQVRKLESGTATTASGAGLIPPSIVSATTSATAGEAVEDGNTVAYQAVLERTDSNGVIVSSGPSGRAIYTNSSGSVKAVDVVYSARGGLTGDRIKIFRTEGVSTGAPSNNLWLVAVAVLTSNAPSLQTILDSTADADAGEILYTSDAADNGGAARTNFRPPAARDLALYQQSLFYIGITVATIKVLRWTQSVDDVFSPKDVIAWHTRAGRRTNGSTDITGIGISAAGLKSGMLLRNPGTSWSGTAPVRITSVVNSTTVRMSSTWNGATDGIDQTLTFVDSMKIDQQYHPSYSATALIQSVNHGTPNTEYRTAPSTSVYVVGLGDDYQNGNVGTYTVALNGIAADDQWQLAATHGELYDPPLPNPSVTPETVEPDEIANGYRWSKADQPEHALPLTRRVGNTTPILRGLVARDAIWMLKGRGDGIYRTSGFGEVSGWRDDIFDASTYLLHARLATLMGDIVYAWTNEGPAAISDSGVIKLGDPIDNLTAELTATFDHIVGEGFACFAVANPKDHEIVFGLPLSLAEGADKSHVGRVFVYNARQNAWAQWFVDADSISCATVDQGDSRRLVYGTDEDGKLRTERGPLDSALAVVPVRTADTDTAITLTAVDTASGAVTISAGSGWAPAVGDLVANTGRYSLVIGVTDLTHFTLDDAAGFTLGAGTAYEAFSARLSWLPRKQGGAHVKRFTQVVTHWDDTRGLLAWSVLMAGNANPDSIVTLEYELEDYQRDNQRRADSRALVPRSVALNTQLYPSVVIRQADARWRISGLTTYFEPATDRVSR